MSSSDNNRRIAKNTMLLYVRMFITMVVSLYTSRVILHVLGIDDFGIYNLVGGVVVLFSFVNTAMITSTQRFLNFELGKSDAKSVARIFSASVTIHVGIVIFVIVCAETVGLWFLNTQLNIPEGRVYAANWVYQFSIAACCINVLKAPYNAAIIAHEKMSFYAYISIVETVLKLVIVYLLVLFTTDKLILYGFLIVAVSFIVFVWYLIYCIKSFGRICVYHFFYERDLYRQLLSFSGWSLLGSVAVISATQGVNMLLNIFFGVVVNASVGIANQVSGVVQQFVSNFQMAFNPQIVKSYAAKDRDYLINIIFKTAKYSCFLIFAISLPILFKTKALLHLWLGAIPPYSVIFCQLILVSAIIESISGPLWMAVQASGTIKKYQIYMSSIKWIEIVGAFILFELGFNPAYAFIVRCVISITSLCCRLFLLIDLMRFPSVEFICKVVWPCVLVCASASLIVLGVAMNFFAGDKLIDILSLTIISIVVTIAIVYCLGLSVQERCVILREIKKQF